MGRAKATRSVGIVRHTEPAEAGQSERDGSVHLSQNGAWFTVTRRTLPNTANTPRGYA